MKPHRPALAALVLSLGALIAAAPPSTVGPSTSSSLSTFAGPITPAGPATLAGPATPPGPATPVASGASAARSPVPALDRAAHPLRTTDPRGDLDDLRSIGVMVNDATVVGLGEATHSSHEFFTMKQRVFRYLVENKGFRVFALEASWSTGQRLNDYVLHGVGDPAQIMRTEFQSTYVFWNNTEYLDLLRWMRGYNVQHRHDPVQFMGDDFAYAGPELYDKVAGYMAKAHPELLPRLTELYRDLRPTTTPEAHMNTYPIRPLAELQEIAGRTGRALDLLKQARPGKGGDVEAYAWAVRNATAIDQTAKGYAFDPDDPGEAARAMRYRDQIMADNVEWWQRHTGSKVLLAAHNGHVALQSHDPQHYPKVQGSFLRDKLGKHYVSIGSTFDGGSFNALDADGRMAVHTVGPAKPGSNEYTLDKARPRDYVLDLRTAPSAARDWLNTPRATWSIGGAYPGPTGPYKQIALANSHDVLIHLHRVSPAHWLPASTAPAGR
ncbi:erythromycin esterase family protein [Streptomyces hundungensis]|uniref:erythromycin esterase family protein n=1 Tax=Streptomyces hundungensis TaxID=1077946 RepID=UPI0033C7594F